MDNTMTCEERLEALCKDWESKYNSYTLERAAYKAMIERENEELRKLVDGVFKLITSNAIEVIPCLSTSGDYYFDVSLHMENGAMPSGQCRVAERLTEERLIEELFKQIWYVLGRVIVNSNCINIREMSKLASYIKLTEMEIRQGKIFASFQERAIKRQQDSDIFNETASNYVTWRRNILSLMSLVSETWYKSTEFLPGMKLVVSNLRTGEASVKVIRSLSKRSADPLFRFTDGSYIPVNSDRILRLGTWFANNDYYRKVGSALGEHQAKLASA